MFEPHRTVTTFHYTAEDFRFYIDEDENNLSMFDNEIKKKWEHAEKNHVLRYTLNISSWKVLDGQYKFLAQLNPNRAHNRRMPEFVESMTQAFDPTRFNFTKVPEKEIIFDIGDGSGNDTLMVNVSPIEWGHCLIVTQRFKCLPQKITEYSLRKAVDMLLLSSSPYLRVIFNSLCAHASVNHLHWHLYYLKHKMLLEYIEVQEYAGPLFLLTRFPSKGFCVKRSCCLDIDNFVFWTFLVIKYLQESQVAHNVYITRAKTTPGRKNYDDIRVYIWARESCTGVKDTSSFIPAVCELFGHLLIRSKEAYESLTEDEVSKILSNVTEPTFSLVTENLKELIKKHISK